MNKAIDFDRNATPLIVVDMQTDFLEGKSRDIGVICAVEKEVIKAVKRNAFIVFLEYECFGKTISKIKKHVSKYNNHTTLLKNNQSGSQEVIYLFDQLGFEPKAIRVCGVNTDECVFSTIRGLMPVLETKIEVVYEATASWQEQCYAWAFMKANLPKKTKSCFRKVHQK